MFKPPKRKRPIAHKLRTETESDNEKDEPRSHKMAGLPAKRKKTKLSKSSVVGGGGLSFNIDEDDDFELHSSQKTKKREKGLGFGGMQVLNKDSDEEVFCEEEENVPTETTKAGSGYSKDELEKLKSQQKVYIAEKSEETVKDFETDFPTVMSSAPNVSSAPIPPAPSSAVPPKPSVPEEDYISLNTCKKEREPVIVSGDDALKYTFEQDDVEMKFQDSPDEGHGEEYHSGQIDDDGDKWEDEIAKRAGVGTSFAKDDVIGSNQIYKVPDSFREQDGRKSIDRIKDTITAALESLNHQEQDLETNITRKDHEADIAEQDAAEKENELSLIGTAFEYYQNLRSDIADWTGALRYLSDKIDVIENSLEDLYQDVGTRRITMTKDWQDDVVTELKEKGCLDYVVGRQPIIATSTKGDLCTVDEFGRDIKSMESLARSKRKYARKRRRSESEDRRKNKTLNDGQQQNQVQREYEDTDADISDNDLMDRAERRSAFSDAVDVIIQDLDDDFRSMSTLLSLFDRWKSMQPDDYKQCYADLALMDYIAPFARAEFCKKLDLLQLEMGRSKSYNVKEFDWFVASEELKHLDSSSTTIEDSDDISPRRTLIEKVCLKSLRMSLFGSHELKNSWSYDPFSARQTILLSTFCRSVMSENTSINKISSFLDDVHDYINRYLQEMAFLIVKKRFTDPEDDPDLLDALSFAVLGQMYRMKKLVSNIVNHWIPLGNKKKFATICIVDILSYRFMPILDTIGPDSNVFERARNIFCSIWNSLVMSGLMDDDELMIISSPIRATALKLGLN